MILADRQRGKTHAAMSVAAVSALQGGEVLWIAPDWGRAAVAFRDISDHYLPLAVIVSAHRTNGRERIRTTAGGIIRFASEGGRDGLRIVDVDGSTATFIFDEAHVPYGFTRRNPKAHVFATVLPPGGEDHCYP